MLYAEKHTFYFRDKPGRQLARVLASPVLYHVLLAMKRANGELTKDVQEKLKIFSDYYSELYVPKSTQGDGNIFFRAFDLPSQWLKSIEMPLKPI